MSQETDEMRSRLLSLIKDKAHKKGPVVLASGAVSDFYIDSKQVSLHPAGALLIGKLFLDKLQCFGKIDAVGGPTLGADPLATATSIVSELEGCPLPAFIVRKEPKAHGTKSWIEGKGNLPANARVVVLEDVVTSGGSSIKAVEKIESEGFEVAGILALVDRQQGGRQTIEERGLRFESLFSKQDVLS